MRRVLIIVAVVLAASCSATTPAAAPATSAPATTAAPPTTVPAEPIAVRSKACDAAINVASENVRTLLKSSAGAVVGASGPAAAAAKMRADAAATRRIIENNRAKCAQTMTECPTVADAYAQWLNKAVDGYEDLATTLEGGTSTGPPDTSPAPELHC